MTNMWDAKQWEGKDRRGRAMRMWNIATETIFEESWNSAKELADDRKKYKAFVMKKKREE